jgi:hypothetical protein
MQAFHLCIVWLVYLAMGGLVGYGTVLAGHPTSWWNWVGITGIFLVLYTCFFLFRGCLRWLGRQFRGDYARGR